MATVVYKIEEADDGTYMVTRDGVAIQTDIKTREAAERALEAAARTARRPGGGG